MLFGSVTGGIPGSTSTAEDSWTGAAAAAAVGGAVVAGAVVAGGWLLAGCPVAEPDMSMPAMSAPEESAGWVSATTPPDDPPDDGAGDDPEPVSGAAPVAEQAPTNNTATNSTAARNAQRVLARVRVRLMVPFRGERSSCSPRPLRSETNDNPTEACRRPVGCHCRGLMTMD